MKDKHLGHVLLDDKMPEDPLEGIAKYVYTFAGGMLFAWMLMGVVLS